MNDTAIREWTKILGAPYVLTDEEALSQYSLSTLASHTRPAAILKPSSTEQIVEIVKIARKIKTPLYPISCGKNWGYGDACAVDDNQVIVDLSRMNKIHEVNEDLAYCVIEPGVTQGQLADYLQKKHPCLFMDATGAGPSASIVGNILERGFGHTPYGNRSETISSMEVVLGSGEILHTGQGHYPHAKSRWVYPAGVGPSLDGLFMQSNFGIITKVGLWLMPRPEHFRFVMCMLDNEDDIGRVVEIIRNLRLDGTARSLVHIGNDLRLISSATTFPTDLQADTSGMLTAENRKKMRRRLGVGAWNISFGLYGNKAQTTAAYKRIKTALTGQGKKVISLSPGQVATAQKIVAVLPKTRCLRDKLKTIQSVIGLHLGQPSAQFLSGSYWRNGKAKPAKLDNDTNPASDNCGFYWVTAMVPATARDIEAYRSIIKKQLTKFKIDELLTFSMVNPRTASAVLTLSFDKNDKAQAARVNECYATLSIELIQSGYIPYRVSRETHSKQLLMMQGETSFWQAVKEIKSIFDPDGIIAPGRYSLK